MEQTNQEEMKFKFKFVNNLVVYFGKINISVFVLICLFTMGSWIDISGVWCDLPLMIDRLPEGWKLPSILGVGSQLAQVGAIMFIPCKKYFPKQFTSVRVNFFILTVGAISCLLLSFFWDKTVIIFNEKRSIYLYIFNFSLSLLDGMSTLTFLPYIGENFSKEYIIPNYIGESLSSLVPGILAMLQGTRTESCSNTTNTSQYNSNSMLYLNNTSLKDPLSESQPRFSVSVYFILMFLLLCISIFSFAMLNCLKSARNARKVSPETLKKDKNSYHLYEINNFSHGNIIPKDLYVQDEVIQPTSNIQLSHDDKKVVYFLYSMSFMISFIYYGVLPALISYSTLPYGNKYLYLSINLNSIFLPIAVFLSIWSYEVSVVRIVIESVLPLLLSVYILVISILSPCPPFVNHYAGGYIITICWILCGSFFIRLRCLIAAKLEKYGEKVLMVYGFFSLLGSMLGGFLIYVCVNIYSLVKEKDSCSPDDFCFSY